MMTRAKKQRAWGRQTLKVGELVKYKPPVQFVGSASSPYRVEGLAWTYVAPSARCITISHGLNVRYPAVRAAEQLGLANKTQIYPIQNDLKALWVLLAVTKVDCEVFWFAMLTTDVTKVTLVRDFDITRATS